MTNLVIRERKYAYKENTLFNYSTLSVTLSKTTDRKTSESII